MWTVLLEKLEKMCNFILMFFWPQKNWLSRIPHNVFHCSKVLRCKYRLCSFFCFELKICELFYLGIVLTLQNKSCTIVQIIPIYPTPSFSYCWHLILELFIIMHKPYPTLLLITLRLLKFYARLCVIFIDRVFFFCATQSISTNTLIKGYWVFGKCNVLSFSLRNI